MNLSTTKKSKWKKRVGYTILSILFLFILLILFIRSPWGQRIIVNKTVTYLKDQTGTDIHIDKLYLTFSGNLLLEGFYIEDKREDTLLYSKHLEASIKLLPLIRGKGLTIQYIDWDGVTANISRKQNDDFNYQFIIDSLVSSPSDSTSSESSTFEIDLGDINLKDFRIKFQDETLGNSLNVNLGVLETEIESFNINEMNFETNSFELKNTQVNFEQTKISTTDEESDILLPIVRTEDFVISNVAINYSNTPEQLFMKSTVGQIDIEDTTVDLRKLFINSNVIRIKNSNFYLKDLASVENLNNENDKNSVANSITWPEWKIRVEKILISDQTITYLTKKNSINDTIFNPLAFKLSDISLNATDLKYNPKNINAEINLLAFNESSGFKLKELKALINVDDKTSRISNLTLRTSNNYLTGSLKATYANINDVFNQPELTNFNLDIPSIKASTKDLKYFENPIKDNIYLEKLSSKKIEGQVYADGTLENLQIKETKISWGDSTQVSLNGNFQNLMAPDSIYVENATVNLQTTKNDLSYFIDTQASGINLPDSLVVHSSLQGNVNKLSTKTSLDSSMGSLNIDGTLNLNEAFGYNGKLAVNQVELGKLLGNTQIGTIDLNSELAIQGQSVNSLNATFDTSFDKLEFNNYDYSALKLNGTITNGEGVIDTKIKDDNINMYLAIKVDLDSILSSVKIDGRVIGADLNALGITPRIIKTQFDVNAIFKGGADAYKVETQVTNGTIVYQNEPYDVNNIKFTLDNAAKKTYLSISSGFINGKLSSNRDMQNTFNGIRQHLFDYINPKNLDIKDEGFIDSSLNFKINDSPVISEVLLPGFKTKDTIRISGNLKEQENTLNLKIKANQIDYNTARLNRFDITADGNKERMRFSISWDSIISDPIYIHKTEVKGILAQQKLKLNFDTYNFKQENTAHIISELEFKNDTLEFHIEPSSLILDKTPWSINRTNKLIVSDDHIVVKDFKISKGPQSLEISTKRPDVKMKHLNFDFQNFNLTNLTHFLNENQSLASGTVNGDICINDPLGKTGLIADLQIDEFALMETPLGNLNLEAESEGFNSYNLSLGLQGSTIDLSIDGSYAAKENSTNVDLLFDLKKLEMKVVEEFFESYISNTTGSLSAKVSLTGDITDLNYNGNFNFNNTGVEINKLNTRFILPNENIKINNKGIYLSNFIIKDSNDDIFTLDGAILTEKSITNPNFDIRLTATDFKVLNSTKEDSDLFYGNMNVNTDLKITGDLLVPKIRGSLSVEKNSSFTLVVPESELEIKEREGVVLFVNRENPDAILTRVDENKSKIPFLEGFDIDTRLQVGNQSNFKIIIDESTGDFIEVHGEGDFIFGMEPNGRMSLTGRYDVSDGLYRVSLYDLVAREFQIKKGGSIIWQGDPLEAELDVTAIYSVETSPIPLVNSRTTLQARDVDFLVYLNVDGQLLTPEISFELDMPEDDRGVMGGAIYGQVQQLNNQEAELNKQVFSLLVLNRFFPESGNDGSNGGVAKLARDNVNSVLAGQLNTISDKILGESDIDLNFGINSYSTYQGNASNSATDLDINAQKSFLDNRLIVQVGSAVNLEGSSQATDNSSPIVGNISLEYLLTQNGRLRLKGFRKNQFESVIDGQLVVTGIAFIFNREFNKFKDLFRSSVKKEMKKQEENKKNNNE